MLKPLQHTPIFCRDYRIRTYVQLSPRQSAKTTSVNLSYLLVLHKRVYYKTFKYKLSRQFNLLILSISCREAQIRTGIGSVSANQPTTIQLISRKYAGTNRIERMPPELQSGALTTTYATCPYFLSSMWDSNSHYLHSKYSNLKPIGLLLDIFQ